MRWCHCHLKDYVKIIVICQYVLPYGGILNTHLEMGGYVSATSKHAVAKGLFSGFQPSSFPFSILSSTQSTSASLSCSTSPWNWMRAFPLSSLSLLHLSASALCAVQLHKSYTVYMPSSAPIALTSDTTFPWGARREGTQTLAGCG